ncbi:MAG TPA: hypothetical protein VL175_17495 [Pirellulales bacterium]|jgi:hypothetical protein|nr:hypothetical protein [Pirellulales bacterium]
MALPDKLLGARLKLKRANKHIRNLAIAVTAFKKSRPCKISTKRNDKGHKLFYVRSLRKVPAEIGAVAGDVLFDLRSALDHIAMQLWIASGSNGKAKDVYFPISKDATEYGPDLARKIKGARPDIVKAIKSIQAYKGGNGHPLWVLNELHNIDKHRLLLTVALGHRPMNLAPAIVAGYRRAGIRNVGFPADFYLGRPGTLYSLKRGDVFLEDGTNTILDKDVKLVFEVAIDEAQIGEGDSILKTLTDLSKFVADVIDTLGGLL